VSVILPGDCVSESQASLLLIDDDAKLAELLTAYLAPEGYRLHSARTGVNGVAQVSAGWHDFVILDVMLPDIDGLEVLRRIRKQSAVPVLMLTARGEDVDRIVGLELGADDYLPKPFNPRELVARIRAILRRAELHRRPAASPSGTEHLILGDIDVDLGAREVRQDHALVELTAVEHDLLVTLLRSAGGIVERAQLFRVLDRDPDPLDRSIDMHISHLRKKLGHLQGGVERIKSIRGVGYTYTVVSRPCESPS
jgi:two-component system, OmpR family, response regulator CpxR